MPRRFLVSRKADKSASRRTRNPQQFAIERLEERTLLATFIIVGTEPDSVAVDLNARLDAANNISLRSAIQAANAQAAIGPHTIQLPAGNYHVTLAGTGDDVGDLDIRSNLTIQSDGAGAKSTATIGSSRSSRRST